MTRKSIIIILKTVGYCFATLFYNWTITSDVSTNKAFLACNYFSFFLIFIICIQSSIVWHPTSPNWSFLHIHFRLIPHTLRLDNCKYIFHAKGHIDPQLPLISLSTSNPLSVDTSHVTVDLYK